MHAPDLAEIPAAANTEPKASAPSTTAVERLGRAAGLLLAPVVALAARARQGRALHLTGTVCAAEVIATAEDPLLMPLAHRLAGAAVVRMSGGMWRHPGPPEVLGCAIRFRGDRPLGPLVAPEDQDLLLATTRRLWLLVPAMLRTRVGDYLHNTYFSASPFELPGIGRVEFRVAPAPAAVQPGDTRDERLAAAMRSGVARLRLEVKRERRRWQSLCDIRLRGHLEIDEEELHYTPFHMGQDLRPRGFINALRAAVYTASKVGRTRT